MFVHRALFCLATLLLGTSALVVEHLHEHAERNALATAHRRHAANILGRSLSPKQRRAQRQKRCLQQYQQTLSSTSATTTSPGSNDVPQNVASDPTPTTPQQDQPQPTPTQDNSGDNNDTGSGNTGGDTYTGDLTFYDVGLGACGGYNTDNDMIAAIGHDFFDTFGGFSLGQNPNNAPICNKAVAVTWGGKTITVTIVDRCGGCQATDLDLSPTAFQQLADPAQGRLHGATWHFV